MARGSVHEYRLASSEKRWLVSYRASNGVQKTRRGFRGPREAERFLNQVAAAVDRGEVVGGRLTFGEYIDGWLADHRPRLEEGSYRDYRTNIDRRLKPFFGRMQLSAITPSDVRRYVAELVGGGGSGRRAAVPLHVAAPAARELKEFTVAELAGRLGTTTEATRSAVRRLERAASVERTGERTRPSRGRRRLVYRYVGGAAGVPPKRLSHKTINNSLMVLRLALGHAEEDGLIARNPAATRPGARERLMLPEQHREMDYLRLDEIPLYLDGCTDDYRPLAELLIATGLRISEALALRLDDIDLDARTIRILRSAKPGGEGSTKGDRFRSVDFGPRIEAILRELWEARATAGHRARLFIDEHGEPLDRSSVSSGEHKDALDAAGLRRTLRLHDLRHTAAASWLACGLPLIYVQRQLGHASIQTTESQYGHLEQSYLRGAAETVETTIWNRRGARPPAAGHAEQLAGAAA
jgi:integrase